MSSRVQTLTGRVRKLEEGVRTLQEEVLWLTQQVRDLQDREAERWRKAEERPTGMRRFLGLRPLRPGV